MYHREAELATRTKLGEEVSMDSPVDVEEVGLRYLAVAHLVRKVVDDRMVTSGLSLSRAKVLQVLADHGPLRQASLAKRLGFAPRSITQAVDGLERMGLVERRPDPDDQRCKSVLATRKGLAALATSTEAGKGVLRAIFGALGQPGLADLDVLLSAIETAQRALPPDAERRQVSV
jgi:DNA-binding MarR family transcriptional regulator